MPLLRYHPHKINLSAMNYHIPRLLFSSIAQTNKEQYQDLFQEYDVFEASTHHIYIAIYPFWLEEYSFPRRNIFSWGYHVRIENHNVTPISITIQHWDIIKTNSRITTIDTKIIENDDAKLNAGEACDYTSCITLDTPSNIVKGYYTISDHTGNIMNIDIPSFNLDNPHDLFSIN